ncbi:MAG: carbonic anhydrase [Methanothrix sp.]|nr:MAG: carbonic anhydrase [Methanothrix sp.]
MKSTWILAVASALLALVVLVTASETDSAITSDAALQKLMEGNAWFVSGNSTYPHQSAERRAELLTSQHPIAVVVGCSDSRASPEIVFDQGLGDIFVIRTAGEVMDNASLGSIEYAVEHLSVPLIVVMGHDSCGAVKAAVDGGEAPGHIANLVEAIKPAVDEAREMGREGQLLNESININVANVVKELSTEEPIISGYVKEGKLKIVGARYYLDSGAVEFFM